MKYNKEIAAIGPAGLLKNNRGFTLIEAVVVLSIVSIVIGMAYSSFRTPVEKLACREIFSAMQLAKMRAISSGSNFFVDFDMNVGSVSDNFYTAYLDTDNDGVFGETLNGGTPPINEFVESQFNLPDISGGNPAKALPSGVSYRTTAMAGFPTGETVLPGDGVDFGGVNAVTFTPRGTATAGGSLYIKDDDNTNRICVVIVRSTGLVRMGTTNDNGANWN